MPSTDPPPTPDPAPDRGTLESRRRAAQRRLAGHHGAFGTDRFGVAAERFARWFGTPQFLIGQTIVVAAWIVLNGIAWGLRWDPYPFILLNLAFSTQAAYSAPLILLAQTRQADRDKAAAEALELHRQAEAQRQLETEQRQAELLARDRELQERHAELLARNVALTEQVAALTRELHATVCRPDEADRP